MLDKNRGININLNSEFPIPPWPIILLFYTIEQTQHPNAL